MLGQAAKLELQEGDEVIVSPRGVAPLQYRALAETVGTPVYAQVYTLRDGTEQVEVRIRGRDGKGFARVSTLYVPRNALRHVPAFAEARRSQMKLRREIAKPGRAETPSTAITRIEKGALHHPSGLIMALDRLGAGHATTAHLGADGWVYLFTKDDARDPAKKVLYNAKKHVPKGARWGKHLPQIEEVGRGSRGARSGHVWRMPKYAKVTGETAALGRRLNKMIAEAFSASFRPGGVGGPAADYQRTPWVMEHFFTQLQADSTVPNTVKQALAHLYEATQDFSETWMFEFPPRNLMQDDKGNLILLDVIFDREALRRLRG